MKAAVLTEPGVISCCEIEQPEVAETEVLVRVAYCGICGSDVPRVWQGTAHEYPIVLGHEFSGTVERVGSKVDQSLLGKRVAGIPLVPCMECADCLAGNYALCNSYSFIGSRRPGAFAEYVSVPVQNIQPISDATDFLQAAFYEPATVALHAIDLVGFESGKSVLISGCGTIGIFLAQVLQARGASRVVATGRREVRLAAARAAGVVETVDTSDARWLSSMRSSETNEGFDLVFDTSGNSDMMVNSFELAANKGTICMVGTPKKEMVFTVQEWENLNRKELTVMGSWMSYEAPWPGSAWKAVSSYFGNAILKAVDEMIDGIYELDDCAEAFSLFKRPEGVSGKILLKCTSAE